MIKLQELNRITLLAKHLAHPVCLILFIFSFSYSTVQAHSLVSNAAMQKTSEGPYGNIFRLSVSSGNYNDETVIRFKEDATLHFDSDLDAYKLMNQGLQPSLYSSSDDINYSINSLPSNLVEKTIPLTLLIAFSGRYSFTADFSEFEGEQTIWLEDRLLGTQQNLRENNVYSVTVEQDSIADRFFIRYRNQDVETVTANTNQSVNSSIEIASYLQTVFVLCPSSVQQADIVVMDSFGKKIYEQDQVQIASGKAEVTLSVPAGVYIVRVHNAHTVASKQVYLSK